MESGKNRTLFDSETINAYLGNNDLTDEIRIDNIENEKVGNVLTNPFKALKKIIEENSVSTIIGSILRRYERIVDRALNMFRSKTKKLPPGKTENNSNLSKEIIEELILE